MQCEISGVNSVGFLRKKRVSETVVAETKIECVGLDETLQKLERLRRLLKEANSLADELASREIDVVISM